MPLPRRLILLACTAVLGLLGACSSGPPPLEPVARGDLAAVQRQVSAQVAQALRQEGLAGLSLALVDDQQVVWSQGFGWANARTRVPATAATRYRVGSISKLFTDTAAMQLVAQGRLDLDAPVTQTLPWFRIGAAGPDDAPISLRQLMSHRAGLPRDRAAGMWLTRPPGPDEDFRAALRALADDELDAPPGLMTRYANLGIDLVGAMIEAATGRPFEAQLQAALLDPLGLREASFSAALPGDAGMARGHFKGEPREEPALRDVPAGGLNASVNDLARFLSLQFAGGRTPQGQALLPEAELAAMRQRQAPILPLDLDLSVGLGWMLSSFGAETVRGGGPVAHHGGATFHFRSRMMMLPAHRLGVVVASNDGAAGPAVNRIAQRALALLLEARTGLRQPEPEPGFVPARQPWTAEAHQAVREACEGDYATLAGLVGLKAEGSRLGVEVDGRRLVLREGETGEFGLGYRLAGLIPIDLGALGQMGLRCTSIDGHPVLQAELGGERLVVGERLAPPALPPDGARWLGRYRPRLAPDEVSSLHPDSEVRVRLAGPRLQLEYRLHPSFGSAMVRVPVVLTAGARLRLAGPLAGWGPVLHRLPDDGGRARVRFQGWVFERVGD